MKNPWTPVKVICGWIFIGWLFNTYVIHQRYLISSYSTLAAIIVIGSLCGFFFSTLETALMKIGDAEGETLKKMIAENNLSFENRKIAQPEYELEKKKNQRYLDQYANRDEHVGPLVIFSNISNIVVAGLVPMALFTKMDADPLYWNLTWLGLPADFLAVPVIGTKGLTIFSSTLSILILGKVIPKTVGGHEKFRFGLFKRFSPVIQVMSVAFGWLATAINAPARWIIKAMA